MKLVNQLIFGLFFATILYSCSPSAPKEAEKKRPNIVFIMSDDHAYQAISAYSNKLIETPNIDRIAKQGMLFTNASVTNSICAPSRAVILTGKHSHLNGKIDNNFPFDTTNVTFPQLLQKEGYQTAMFGKLHFGNSPKGFDQFKILPGQGAYYNPDFITKNEGNIKVEGYVTDIITDMTLNWLDKERDAEKPFLLMYLHKAPHREWLPAERHYTEYINKTFEEPATLFDNYEGRGSAAKEAEMNLLTHMNWAGDSKIYPDVMDELGIPETANWDKAAFKREVGRMNPEQRAKWDAVYGPMNEEFKKNYPNMTREEKMKWRYQRYMQDYLGSIASVDEGVGKVLDYLEQNGLAENTIIVYTSDQGFYLGEHGWFDKRFIYNESFKTPLLVKWPGVVQPGTTNTQMVQNLDFAPTLLSAVGAEVPADMQGESLIPLLKGENDSFKRDAVYYHYYEYPGVHMVKRHYGIVTEDYKLVHFYYDVDEWELYDRKKDLQEMTNVYDDPAYADVVKDLKEKLAGLRVKYKDSEELDQMYIEKYKELK
ncbi:sulfatase [uncultured Imperialibacter sp.]|uniref:sulfatase family protein n=1 Tax=uncultured Imperialibacter sp. TaxID=1672639 RepID=UPI0030DCCBD3|tara:strand:+ start:26720 stop:28339 length:1620 start_codon:yes stop_codon:yes gene_type:complete